MNHKDQPNYATIKLGWSLGTWLIVVYVITHVRS